MLDEFVIVNPPFEMVAPEKVQEPDDDFVYFFTAPWCGLCKTTKTPGELRALGYRCIEIDQSKNPEIVEEFNVTGFPSFAIVDGRTKKQLGSTLKGSHTTQSVVRLAESFIYISKTGSHVNRSSLINHLVRDHGFKQADLEKKTASQLDRLHVNAHEGS